MIKFKPAQTYCEWMGIPASQAPPAPQKMDPDKLAEYMQDGPRKEASPRCESGGRDWCTCEICF